MTEPSSELKEALAQVQAPWDELRTERTLPGLARRARQRKLRTRALAGAASAVAIGVLLWFARGALAPHQLAAPNPAPAPRAEPLGPTPEAAPAAPTDGVAQTLSLPGGSQVQLLDAHTDVVLEEREAGRLALRIRSGRARFSARDSDPHALEVRTAHVVFLVLASEFEVAESVERTWVRVEHGQVTALASDARRELSAGDEAWFGVPPPAAQGAHPSERSARNARPGSSDERKPDRRSAPRPSTSSDAAAPAWREHAERGEFGAAYPLLPQPQAVAQMDVSELLLAADAARLSGHPRAALPFLSRVVEQHPEDERAPLAAFTLGGVLMNQLGMPREAEAAYAKARAAALGGALAQDALARQVEAAHRAGDDALARTLARDYLEHYPQGRRARAVRRFGGL